MGKSKSVLSKKSGTGSEFLTKYSVNYKDKKDKEGYNYRDKEAYNKSKKEQRPKTAGYHQRSPEKDKNKKEDKDRQLQQLSHKVSSKVAGGIKGNHGLLSSTQHVKPSRELENIKQQQRQRFKKVKQDFTEATSGNRRVINDLESIKSSLQHMVALKRQIDKVSQGRSSQHSRFKST